MPRPKARKLSKKESKALAKQREEAPFEVVKPVHRELAKKIVELPQVVTIRALSEMIGISPAKLIQTLLKNGVGATINESIDFDTAAIIADEFNIELKHQQADQVKLKIGEENAKPRPPIVTVMGHVDHGKTKLLDAIRKTNIVETESGSITQHIGAYQVSVKTRGGGERKITFLDTPGHEAFSTLRAHGANITDMVVLVVAADDGVKPQTIEALSHARSANVPIIVALNKIDLPQANIEKVKGELAKRGLVPEAWGGQTPTVEISAKQNVGIDRLLETILLTYDLKPSLADFQTKASGAIVEAHLNPKSGPLATAIVTQGTIRMGDFIVAGRRFGKVRFLKDWHGRRLDEAEPGTPVVISGLRGVPEFGDTFEMTDDERESQSKAAQYKIARATSKLRFSPAGEGQKTLNLIIKADATASVEALVSTIEEMSTAAALVKIVSSGVGMVTEGDITLSETTSASILAFRSPVSQSVEKLAKERRVQIDRFDIIYQAIDKIKELLRKLVEPKIIRTETGRLKVTHVFMQAADAALVGGTVADGQLNVRESIYVLRDSLEIGQGKAVSIQLEKTPANGVKKGQTCGVRIKKNKSGRFKIKPGDLVVAHKMEKVL